MSFDNDEDRELGVFCQDCGDETFVNPVTGLCLDCELEAGLDEEEGDDEDRDVCVSCGGSFLSDALNDDDECEQCENE